MADKDIIMCRCEDITRERILECIAQGYRTIDEIKRVTRAGMGPCQGRTCRLLIAQELSKAYGVPMEEVLMPTFRPPTKPITMGALADAYREGGEDA
ncbi:MAG: (2Fe-2S)-binding protein [Clostridiales bacterium]|nr:(2Fe-2S)-binding protein [Clostridiales bacterium]